MTIRKSKKVPSKPTEVKKNDEDDIQIIPLEVLQSLSGGGHASAEDQALEQRGIILIDREISKQTLSTAYKKLLYYHFNVSFTDPIQIIINSPGGYCDAGWAFIDLMGFVKNKIVTIAMGEICSMATGIFIAGDERIMSPNCNTMIHQFSDGAQGNYGDLVARSKMWDIETEKEFKHLINCSKYKTKEEILKHLLKENDHWLTPTEMKKHGLCDRIFVSRKRGTRK
jgi:ATP-dependent Clp endopeptidase proteolytic subunit ClpP